MGMFKRLGGTAEKVGMSCVKLQRNDERTDERPLRGDNEGA